MSPWRRNAEPIGSHYILSWMVTALLVRIANKLLIEVDTQHGRRWKRKGWAQATVWRCGSLVEWRRAVGLRGGSPASASREAWRIYLEQGGTCRLKTKELTKLGRYYEDQWYKLDIWGIQAIFSKDYHFISRYGKELNGLCFFPIEKLCPGCWKYSSKQASNPCPRELIFFPSVGRA